MAQTNQPSEQRLYPRYPLKNEIFLSVQGDAGRSSCPLTDLSQGGAGCLSDDINSALEDRFILCNLTSEDQVILRSLTARVVFSSDGRDEGGGASTSRRYGLQFINLTPLQKRQLGMIANKYGQARGQAALPCRSTGLSPMVPSKNMPS